MDAVAPLTVEQNIRLAEQTLKSITTFTRGGFLGKSSVQIAHLTFNRQDIQCAQKIAEELVDNPSAKVKLIHILAERVIRKAPETGASFKTTSKAHLFEAAIVQLRNNKDLKYLFQADRAEDVFNKYLVEAFARENKGTALGELDLSIIGQITHLDEDAVKGLICKTPEYQQITKGAKKSSSLEKQGVAFAKEAKKEAHHIEEALLAKEQELQSIGDQIEAIKKLFVEKPKGSTERRALVSEGLELRDKYNACSQELADLQVRLTQALNPKEYQQRYLTSISAKSPLDSAPKAPNHRTVMDMIASMEKALRGSSPALFECIEREMMQYKSTTRDGKSVYDDLVTLTPVGDESEPIRKALADFKEGLQNS